MKKNNRNALDTYGLSSHGIWWWRSCVSW